ncbi:MAG: antitoxin [Lentisphaerae bacterium]|nr:antitoxin [Lentisphaerota bacterium]
MKKILLTKEEAALEHEIEAGEWVAVPNMAEETRNYQAHARNALKKLKKINIRMSDWDYNNIKLRAVQEGLPYQTLVSSIIHKYLTGQIKTS